MTESLEVKKVRKGITKKLRIEIFKRDSFKCRYCGKSAPEVALHLDHVNPVAKGGGNDPLNLITSCEACNQGKSATLINDRSFLLKQTDKLQMILEYLNSKGITFSYRREAGGHFDLAVDEVLDWCSDKIGMEAKWSGVSREHYIAYCNFTDEGDLQYCEFIDENNKKCNARSVNYLRPFYVADWNPLNNFCKKHMK